VHKKSPLGHGLKTIPKKAIIGLSTSVGLFSRERSLGLVQGLRAFFFNGIVSLEDLNGFDFLFTFGHVNLSFLLAL
jgi:hypothetical protein